MVHVGPYTLDLTAKMVAFSHISEVRSIVVLSVLAARFDLCFDDNKFTGFLICPVPSGYC